MTGTIAMGSDHAGFSLKEELRHFLAMQEIETVDFGCYDTESIDYPEVAHLVAKAVLDRSDCSFGILCCGSGVGVAITANRHKGIRAVTCHDLYTAMMSRRHTDANVVCFGGRVIAAAYAQELLRTFLNTPFEGERHQKRVDMIDAYKEEEMV